MNRNFYIEVVYMSKKIKLLTDANPGIKANVLSLNNGLQEYEKVNFIRIKSKYYNIIIMKDYLPIIGEVQGSVEIELQGKTIKLDNIIGYYMHKKNRFHLFIKEEIAL